MLDKIPVNILTCSASTLVIDYANASSINTLNNIAHLLPEGIKGDNIIGQNIDIFHRAPAYQRHILKDKSTFPHSAIIID